MSLTLYLENGVNQVIVTPEKPLPVTLGRLPLAYAALPFANIVSTSVSGNNFFTLDKSVTLNPYRFSNSAAYPDLFFGKDEDFFFGSITLLRLKRLLKK